MEHLSLQSTMMEEADAHLKQITEIFLREKELLAQERKRLAAEIEEWNKTKKKLEESQTHSKIKLDVGGKVFATSLSTLTNGKSGYFSAMFGGRWALKKDEDNCYFIDRDPTYFKYILNFLRGEYDPKEFSTWKEKKLDRLQQDIDFYQIQGMKIRPDVSKITINWNPKACGPNVQFTNNNCTAAATAQGIDCQSLVLSENSFNTGIVTFEVRTDHFVKPSHWIAVGVAHSKVTRCAQSYSISSNNHRYPNGSTTASGDWKDGDVIRVTLDCDNHSLEVKNTRTGRGESWTLPSDGLPWHLYACLYNKGDQVTTLPATLLKQ